MTTITTNISNKDEKFLYHATQQALLSPVLMRHGAVAVINGKIMGRGHNHYRTHSMDGLIHNTCTCHAEIAAIRNMQKSLTNTYGKYGEQIKVG